MTEQEKSSAVVEETREAVETTDIKVADNADNDALLRALQ